MMNKLLEKVCQIKFVPFRVGRLTMTSRFAQVQAFSRSQGDLCPFKWSYIFFSQLFNAAFNSIEKSI